MTAAVQCQCYTLYGMQQHETYENTITTTVRMSNVKLINGDVREGDTISVVMQILITVAIVPNVSVQTRA